MSTCSLSMSLNSLRMRPCINADNPSGAVPINQRKVTLRGEGEALKGGSLPLTNSYNARMPTPAMPISRQSTVKSALNSKWQCNSSIVAGLLFVAKLLQPSSPVVVSKNATHMRTTCVQATSRNVSCLKVASLKATSLKAAQLQMAGLMATWLKGT